MYYPVFPDCYRSVWTDSNCFAIPNRHTAKSLLLFNDLLSLIIYIQQIHTWFQIACRNSVNSG